MLYAAYPRTIEERKVQVPKVREARALVWDWPEGVLAL